MTFGPRPLARVAFVVVLAGATNSGLGVEPSDQRGSYFATRLGDDTVVIRRVDVGADGSVYAAGASLRADLPGTVESPDPDRARVDPYFVTCVAPTGEVRWTRYLPLLFGSYWYDAAQVADVAVAADGSVWLAGSGAVLPPGFAADGYRTDRTDADAWVARFAADGTPLFALNVGGVERESATGVALTVGGDAIVVGTTWSRDFPTLLASQPEFGGGQSDGFAFRVRGDGSGLSWATYIGGPEHDDVTAAAAETSGSAIIGTRVRQADLSYTPSIDAWPLRAVGTSRLSPDGFIVATAPLPHRTRGGVFALDVASDGVVFAGGVAEDWNVPPREGFVARLAPDSLAIQSLWRRRGEPVLRLSADDAGGLLVVTQRDFSATHVLRVSPDLGRTSRVVSEHQAGRAADVAHGPGGEICVVGNGEGVAFPQVPAEGASEGAYVTRLPERGAVAPRAARVRGVGLREVDLAWTSAGRDIVRYEIDEEVDDPESYRPHYVTRLAVAGAARRARIVGLRAAASYRFRVVAVHASGVRAATGPIDARTPPAPVARIVATRLADGNVRIDFEVHKDNDNSAEYIVQRAVSLSPGGESAGEFRTVRGQYSGLSSHNGRGWFVHRPDSDGAPFVTYRIRAFLSFPRKSSAWTYGTFR